MKIREYKAGEKMRVQKKIYSTNEGKRGAGKETVTVQVVKQYPHHILVKTEKGTRWCITNGELYQMAFGEKGEGRRQK